MRKGDTRNEKGGKNEEKDEATCTKKHEDGNETLSEKSMRIMPRAYSSEKQETKKDRRTEGTGTSQKDNENTTTDQANNVDDPSRGQWDITDEASWVCQDLPDKQMTEGEFMKRE